MIVGASMEGSKGSKTPISKTMTDSNNSKESKESTETKASKESKERAKLAMPSRDLTVSMEPIDSGNDNACENDPRMTENRILYELVPTILLPLGSAPVWAHCHICGRDSVTELHERWGPTAYLLFACMSFSIVCLPFALMMPFCKSVNSFEHHCGCCGSLIGTSY